MKIKSYNFNNLGKDYVVGDIHGEFRKLKRLLKKIKFDFTNDRLFSVGDLCDRGRHSKDILKWIDYSWFIPVRGNHEVMILNHIDGYLDNQYMIDLEAHWIFSLNIEKKKKVYRYFNNLPIAIEICNENRSVGIVHAMCPVGSWNYFKELLLGPNYKHIEKKAMWSFLPRDIIVPVSDIDIIFVGHNTVPDVTQSHNTYLLDTGSGYRKGRLTIFDMVEMEIIISG